MASADRLIDLFHEAKALSTEAERRRFLVEACGDETEMQQQVLSLLEAHEGAADFLQPSPLFPPPPLVTEKAGDRIDRYKLLEQIGEGGCGVVYMAEQKEPVRRRVALKVIKLGMDTRQMIARFEAERQALALMDHPNIARVFDAGTTERGRPFFVMELVRGVKITDFCDEQKLSTDERLGLFIQVCQAIQHAHQKGVIHRDIKPSNILVTINDNAPVPKVIDFGIAKATLGRLTDQTLFTAFEQFIGTPAYMSPEQAVMTSLDVDTRSDIYSLGVLLYELLTGRTPFDAKELVAAGLDTMRQIIREQYPMLPSTRLSTLSIADRNAAAAQRNEEPAKLHRVLRGDLDWIVMKALEKDRTRRYETVGGLAGDVRHHLENEPVVARPPSRTYRLRKLVRRNRLMVSAGAIAVTALVLVAVGSMMAAWRVGLAREAEHDERAKADGANRDLREVISMLELQRAEDLIRAHDAPAGVAQLSATLRHDPTNRIAANRLVSALIHRDWALPIAKPMMHLDKVVGACFSPDGRHVLSASLDNTARIWDAETGQAVATLQHSARLYSAHYSRDGTRIVTASADGTARVWNASDGAPVLTLDHRSRKVWWAEFSPDGKSVATACAADNATRVWDVATGRMTKELSAHSSEVVLARFSPDGQFIATASKSGAICLYDADSGQLIMRLIEHTRVVLALAFSPDGSKIASGGEDGVALIWNTTTGEILATLVHDDNVRHIAFSPSGELVLTASQGGAARLWNAVNGALIGQPLLHRGNVVFGAFNSDGRMLVTTSMDNSAQIWDARTGQPLYQPLREREAILQAGFSPDGTRLVTAEWDRRVQIWDLHPRRYSGIAMDHGARITSVAFDPRGKSVFSASDDGVARLWDSMTGLPLGETMRHRAAILAANYSADGRLIVTASEDGTACIWDAQTGRLTAGPLPHAKDVWWAQFSPDGEQVVTASADGTARIWDVKSGAPVTPPMDHGAEVKVANFSPDGRKVVTASDNKSARVWDAETGLPLTERLPHADRVEWAEFSPDGKRIVSAASDNTARIWDAETGRRIGAPLRHARTVQKAVFSPDGRRVATASLDRTARVWDATTGEPLTEPMFHEKSVSQICFSPDGERVLTACWSGKSRIWDAATGRPLTEWLPMGAPRFNACFDSTGRRVLGADDRGIVRVWDVPPVPTPVPPWFLALAEAVAGTRLDSRGDPERVSRQELESIASRLPEARSDDFYERLAKWFLADPEHRPVSPF